MAELKKPVYLRLSLPLNSSLIMETIEETFEKILFHNSIQNWACALLGALIAFGLLQITRRILIRKLTGVAARTETLLDDLALALLGCTNGLILFVLTVYVALSFLHFPQDLGSKMGRVASVMVILQLGIWGNQGISFWITQYLKPKSQRDVESASTLGLISFVAKFFFYVLLTLLLLNNLGINITALVAGLGVGGIAVALAVQNVLGDLFASLTIILDKPFVVGDFITVGDFLGSVENIGLKTTRIRSLSGEQVIFSNSDLLQSRIRNFKRMFERRVVFQLGVIYETPAEMLEKIPSIVKGLVEKQNGKHGSANFVGTRFDRGHFFRFGAYSLDFEFVYWVLSPDYTVHMDIQQAVLLDIYREFGRIGIQFAFPTQTIIVEPQKGPHFSPEIAG